VETLAYADIFDYAVTAEQIHRYLERRPASLAHVRQALASDPWLRQRVEQYGDMFCLAGRSAIVPLRPARAAHARALWRPARLLAALTAHFPFVRLVAVIGSLTTDNARSLEDDIDLLIVTAPGRVWLTRALVIGLVRLAALRRIELCPNYILSERRLAMGRDDLYIAHELAQMIPLYGRRAFAELLTANAWLSDYLPNAPPLMADLGDLRPLGRLLQRAAERLLGGRLGDRLEKRLQTRKLAELRQQAAASGSQDVLLDAEVCKGHMGGHGARTRSEYARRRAAALAGPEGA
jgi:hypothetical protein